MYFCHMCSIEIRPLMTPQPTCPRCNGGFVEEIDSSQDVREEEGITATANEQFWSDGPAGIHDQGPGLDIGSFMTTILRNLAASGQDARRTTSSDTPNRSSSPHPQEPETDPLTGGTYSQNDQAGSSSTSSTNNGNGFRTGTTRFGPLNVTWGMGSHTMQGGSGFGSAGFGTFGGRSNPPDDHLEPVHDDGMGGAGGAADGRFFNHDNNNNNNNDNHGSRMPGAVPSSDEPDLPPELQSLREVFSNLFGGINDGPAGMLVDLFGNAFRGRSGDYVWGQQGLDDVISQLMEQTRGSTAPPPASDEAIAKLEKFSRKDIEKVRQARNRECSTCMDSFEDEESAPAHDASKDSNLPTGITGSSEMDVDDPPETAPEEGQQDELVMMPCKHLFHEDCLIPWLKNSGTCPVCRVSLEPKKTTEDSSQTSAESSAGPSSTTTFVPATSEGSAQFNTHPNRPISSTGFIQEREDTDVEYDEDDIDEESPNQRRERMRRAAEARAGAAVPGSFPEPDDLD